jgi:hypothetical protein
MYRKFSVTENLFFYIVHFSMDLNTRKHPDKHTYANPSPISTFEGLSRCRQRRRLSLKVYRR